MAIEFLVSQLRLFVQQNIYGKNTKQSKSTQACTKTRHFEIRKMQKKFLGGDTPSPDLTSLGAYDRAYSLSPTALKLNVTPPHPSPLPPKQNPSYSLGGRCGQQGSTADSFVVCT